ncbi:MAG: putative Ig domain-containing protein [Candidatus Omnitrophota bacterium]
MYSYDKHDLIIDGFEVKNGNAWIRGGQNIVMRNIKLHDADSPPSNYGGFYFVTTNNVLVENNEIYDVYDHSFASYLNDADPEHHGAIAIMSGGEYGNPGVGLNIIIRNNLIYNVPTGVYNKNWDYGPIFYYNNKITAWHVGLYMRSSNITAHNNIICGDPAKNQINAFDIDQGVQGYEACNVKVYNNTVYDVGGVGVGIKSRAQNPQVYNNIIYTPTGTTYAGAISSFSSVVNMFSNYNNLLQSPTGVFDYVGYSTLSSWRSASGQDANSISANPLFVDANNGDFHLQGSSPAINAGMDLQDYDNDGNTTERINMGAYITGNEAVGLLPTEGRSIFFDDFEGLSPLDKWSGYSIGPSGAAPHLSANGGSVTLTSALKSSGNQSLECKWASGDYALGLTKRLNMGREIYFRWYGRWEGGWDWPSSHKYWIFWGNPLRIEMCTYDAGAKGHYLTFYSTEYGDKSFAIWEKANNEYPLNPSGPPHPNCAYWQIWQPQEDTWYCFEAYLKIHPTEGRLRFWIDGVEKQVWEDSPLWGSWWYNNYTPVTPVNVNTGNADIETLDISTQNNDQISTRNIYFDDIAISTQYIGPLQITPDYTAPSVPANLTATAASTTQINLSWSASTDNIGVTGYRIYRDGSQVGISTTTSYQDTGLTASTTYNYRVAAYDAAGNLSAQSTQSSATTQALPNNAPVANNQSVSTAEDTALNITLSATDSDNDTLTYSVLTQPSYGTLTGTAPNLAYTPQANYFGNDSFTFKANDGEADSNIATISISITTGNDAPVLVAIGNRTVDEGSNLAFTLSATDADGDTLTYSADTLPAGATLDPALGRFSFTPDYTQAGTYNVTFSVRDAQGGSDSESITITVNNINQAPMLSFIGDKSVNEGEPLSFVVTATDPDGDTITYSASNLPSGANFNASTHTFSWTPASAQAGTYPGVHFEVSDGSQSSYENITITVSHINNPPVLEALGDKTVAEGALLTFTVSASDPDADTLTFSAENLPAGASFNNRTFSWRPGYEQAGSYNVDFIVSDGNGSSDSETITITVTNINRSPIVTNIPSSLNKSEGEVLTAAEIELATDPDADTLTYTYSGWLNSLPYNISYADSGIHTLHIAVSDGALTSEKDIIINVSNVNRPPILDPIGNKSIDEGTTLSFNATASDPDSDSVTITAAGLQSWMNFDGVTFNANPGYANSGNYSVAFSASDGSLSDTESITISVGEVNRPPTLAPIGNRSVNEGSLLAFTISATDADSDTLVYSADNLPTGAGFNAATRTFSWTPGYSQAGTYPNVTFNVLDGNGGTDSESITITVVNVNRPPDLSAMPGSLAKIEGQTITNTEIELATDPEADTLTYTYSGWLAALPYTIAYSDSGEHTLHVIVSDGNLIAEKDISVSVSNVNRPPEISITGNTSVSENELVNIIISGNDPDSDILDYSVEGLPEGATFTKAADSDTRLFQWVPRNNQVGDFRVLFRINDELGLSDEELVVITVNDTIAALINITSPVDASVVTSSPVRVSGSITEEGSGIASVNVNNYPAVISNNSFNYDLALAEGANTITVTCWDNAGNENSAQIKVTLDTSAPALSIQSPQNDSFVNTATPQLIYTSDGRITGLSVDSRQIPIISSGELLPELSEGRHSLSLTAQDVAGNTATTTINFVIDVTAPTGSLSIVKHNGYTNNRNVTLDISANDNLSGVHQMKIKEEAGRESEWMPYASTAQWALSDPQGNKNLALSFRDNSGNIAEDAASDSIILDTLAPRQPTAEITSPNRNGFTKEEIISLSGTKEAGSSVLINGAEIVPVSDSETWSSQYTLSKGKNILAITSRDIAGNESSAFTLTITLKRNVIHKIIQPIKEFLNSSDLISGSSDVAVSYTIDEEAQIRTETFTLQEGGNDITLITEDFLGNVGEQSLNFVLDTIAPQVSVTSHRSGEAVSSSNVTLAGSVLDTNSGIQYVKVNASPAILNGSNFSSNLNLSTGANSIVVEAADNSGNITALTITLDYSPVTNTETQTLSRYGSIVFDGAKASSGKKTEKIKQATQEIISLHQPGEPDMPLPEIIVKAKEQDFTPETIKDKHGEDEIVSSPPKFKKLEGEPQVSPTVNEKPANMTQTPGAIQLAREEPLVLTVSGVMRGVISSVYKLDLKTGQEIASWNIKREQRLPLGWKLTNDLKGIRKLRWSKKSASLQVITEAKDGTISQDTIRFEFNR